MKLGKIPSLLLALLLQVVPLARVAFVNPAFSSSSFAVVFKFVAGAGMLLGAVDAVSGASAYIVGVRSIVPPGPVTNRIVTTVGVTNKYQIVVGNPGVNTSLDFYDAAPLPDGLSVSPTTIPGTSTVGGRITGVATTPGTTFPVTLTAGNYLYLDGSGNPITVTTNITIVVNPAGGGTAPTITTPPKSLVVTQGFAASFSVTASGTPAPTYEWRRDGQKINGATGATFTIASAQPSDEAGYTVVVSNSGGSITSSPPASLTVQVPPAITTQPAPLTVTSGSLASFHVVATGKPAPGYQWQKDGKAIGGATTDTYSIPAAQVGDEGVYTVVVSNGVGQPVTSTGASLTVEVPPTITTQPLPVTVTGGSLASFHVVAAGKPAPGYQWQKDGKAIGGATTDTYSIPAAQVGDEGVYTVVVSNGVGQPVTSTGASLTVQVPPSILTAPTAVAVDEGFDATFTVAAGGKPAPTFQWKKGGVAIGGETASTLVIHKATPSDEGDYSVELTNAAGSVTTVPVHLTVNPVTVAEVRLTNLALVDGLLSFDANCPAGRKCEIWRTDDLATWTLDETLVPSNGNVHYSVQIPSGNAARAFKAVVVTP